MDERIKKQRRYKTEEANICIDSRSNVVLLWSNSVFIDRLEKVPMSAAARLHGDN